MQPILTDMNFLSDSAPATIENYFHSKYSAVNKSLLNATKNKLTYV
ncbi:unnamed protein product, partial [Rotaria magnacalcarata]